MTYKNRQNKTRDALVENIDFQIKSDHLLDNKILFRKNAKKDHYCIIGGRIEIGENSEQTVKREVMEELGKEIEITGYAATIENFFEMDNKKYHEIMFIYFAEFKDKDAQFSFNLKHI